WTLISSSIDEMVKRGVLQADTRHEMSPDLKHEAAPIDDSADEPVVEQPAQKPLELVSDQKNGRVPTAKKVDSQKDAARELAAQYRLPLIDLAVCGIATEATKLIPLRVLERVVAIPYAVEDGVLKLAGTHP